jgi:hypothetical protein
MCLLTTYSLGQRINLLSKQVKGIESKITENKNVGIMDTVLFLLQGQITKHQDVWRVTFKPTKFDLRNGT